MVWGIGEERTSVSCWNAILVVHRNGAQQKRKLESFQKMHNTRAPAGHWEYDTASHRIRTARFWHQDESDIDATHDGTADNKGWVRSRVHHLNNTINIHLIKFLSSLLVHTARRGSKDRVTRRYWWVDDWGLRRTQEKSTLERGGDKAYRKRRAHALCIVVE